MAAERARPTPVSARASYDIGLAGVSAFCLRRAAIPSLGTLLHARLPDALLTMDLSIVYL